MPVSQKLVVILHVLTPSEFLKHYHLIAPILWWLGKEHLLLLILGGVYNVGPSLLVFGLERLEELVEGLVTLGHGLDALIQGLTPGVAFLFDKRLKFLDLCDGLWSAGCLLPALFAVVGKEQHLVFLEPVLVPLQHHWWLCSLSTTLDGLGEHHGLVLS